jgi:uncharacterized protein YcnI
MWKSLLAAALAAGTAVPAAAHTTLETQETPVGSAYKAVLRVGHGCEGEATLKLRVRIPEGFIAVKPMPKAGWSVETVTGPYGQAHDYYGTELTEGVTEIIWTGELLDAHYDEFVLRGTVVGSLEPGGMLYFPTVQECATKSERWIEIPADGQDADSLEGPAPGVRLVPALGGH